MAVNTSCIEVLVNITIPKYNTEYVKHVELLENFITYLPCFVMVFPPSKSNLFKDSSSAKNVSEICNKINILDEFGLCETWH